MVGCAGRVRRYSRCRAFAERRLQHAARANTARTKPTSINTKKMPSRHKSMRKRISVCSTGVPVDVVAKNWAPNVPISITKPNSSVLFSILDLKGCIQLWSNRERSITTKEQNALNTEDAGTTPITTARSNRRQKMSISYHQSSGL
jgi:hypothetical protein